MPFPDLNQYNTDDPHPAFSIVNSAPTLSIRILCPPSTFLNVGAAPPLSSSCKKRKLEPYQNGSEASNNERLSKTIEVSNLSEKQNRLETSLVEAKPSDTDSEKGPGVSQNISDTFLADRVTSQTTVKCFVLSQCQKLQYK